VQFDSFPLYFALEEVVYLVVDDEKGEDQVADWQLDIP